MSGASKGRGLRLRVGDRAWVTEWHRVGRQRWERTGVHRSDDRDVIMQSVAVRRLDDGWQAFAMFVGGGQRSGLATRADAFQAAESILRGGL